MPQLPAVVLKNLLYQNWSQTSPARDSSTPETFNTSLVHFTTRKWATNPQRIHRYQVSVLSGIKRTTPEEVGSLVMYKVEEEINIHAWAIAGIGGDWETTEQNLRNMLDQIDLAIRLSATAASGIQFIRLAPGAIMADDLDRLILHRTIQVTAIYYRTETVLPPLIPFPSWDTAPWLWDTTPALWS